MVVRVKLYATLNRYVQGLFPGTPFDVELPVGANLRDLVVKLEIPPEETKITFVNGIIQPLDFELQSGDDVGIFPPVAGGSMKDITVDVWLYGELARYAGEQDQTVYANLLLKLPAGSTMGDLLNKLQMPSEARGVTFINGELSAMPGLQPDLEHVLQEGDRVAFFHLRSMWPFQYRFGVAMVEEMAGAMREDPGLHHAYPPDQP